ncbi:MAG: 50S ribosomal protein L24 [Gammaproteobacteria bacterium]|nr:50S ribosomal protein L24 [Gammaproteobacteria bacterium]
MAKKIKIGDMVIALAGKDQGRSGKVIKFVKKDRVLVEGINMVKKHVRGNPQAGTQGGIIEREAGIHISNLALLNPISNKADRVGFKDVGGKKVRYFKSNGEVVDV